MFLLLFLCIAVAVTEKYVTNANFTTKEMKAVINRADLAHFLLTDAVTTSDEYKHISVCVCDA
jgi:ketol-acid reductoisomerase